MKRWYFPALYFLLCEMCDVLWEFGMTKQTDPVLGIAASLLLAMLVIPALPVLTWVQVHTASLLGIAPGDTIGLNSFWPRMLSIQSAIVVCTLVLVLVALGPKLFLTRRERP
jgi:hypothetical protein